MKVTRAGEHGLAMPHGIFRHGGRMNEFTITAAILFALALGGFVDSCEHDRACAVSQ